MALTILISADACETRVAMLEGGKLVDFEVEREDRIVGSIFHGRVTNVLAGMDAAFVDIGLHRTAFIYVTDVIPEADELDGSDEGTEAFESIAEALQVGQELLVQVVRPGVGTKGPRVSTRISLPGRYTVVLVHGKQAVRVSRRITEEHERKRLLRIAERTRPLDFGLIVRTEAEGRSEAELQQDVSELVALWSAIEQRLPSVKTPALVHRDLGLVGRVVRDWLNADVQQIIVDNQVYHDQIVAMLRRQAPDFVSRLTFDQEPIPLFERHQVEDEISRALEPAVPLRRGGYLMIEETEALTAIDVNTGRYVGKTRLAETVLRTNLEAAHEIARQLRLRDIGGIVVIDFIDMERARDRVQVMNALESALRRDRTRTRIVNISPLGLVEMTRRREGRSLREVLHRSCPYCRGLGTIKSAITVALETRRKIRQMALSEASGGFVVRMHPEAASLLVGTEGEEIAELEKETKREISVEVLPESSHMETVEIVRLAEARPAGVDLPLQTFRWLPERATYPDGTRLFGVIDNRLLKIPEEAADEESEVTLRMTGANRWFLESQVDVG